jgi:hypothetical protein
MHPKSTTIISTHPHLTLLGPLLELDTLLVKPLDGSFEVIDSYANMTETSSNVIISRCISLEFRVGFWLSACTLQNDRKS